MGGLPAALGLSVGWYYVMWFPMNAVPYSWVAHVSNKGHHKDDMAKVWISILWLFFNAFITKCVAIIIRFNARRTKLPHAGCLRNFLDEMWELTVKALPFVLAWNWADFGFHVVFGVMFGCTPGTPTHSHKGCPPMAINLSL